MPSPRGSQRERGSPEEGERPSSLDGVSFIRIIRFLRVSEADRPGGSLHLCGRRRKRKKRTRADPCRSCSSHSSLFALAISPRSAGRVRSYALRKRLSKRTNVHRSIRLGSHSSPFSHAGGGRLAHLSLKSREKSDESEARALDHTRGRAVSLTRATLGDGARDPLGGRQTSVLREDVRLPRDLRRQLDLQAHPPAPRLGRMQRAV